MISTFIVCVALFAAPHDTTPIERSCTTITGNYAETLSYFVRHQEDFVDIVTYDRTIQVEYNLDLPTLDPGSY